LSLTWVEDIYYSLRDAIAHCGNRGGNSGVNTLLPGICSKLNTVEGTVMNFYKEDTIHNLYELSLWFGDKTL